MSDSEDDGPISEGLFQAYSVAESVRMPVISQRQKQAVEADEKKVTDNSDPGNVKRDWAES